MVVCAPPRPLAIRIGITRNTPSTTKEVEDLQLATKSPFCCEFALRDPPRCRSLRQLLRPLVHYRTTTQRFEPLLLSSGECILTFIFWPLPQAAPHRKDSLIGTDVGSQGYSRWRGPKWTRGYRWSAILFSAAFGILPRPAGIVIAKASIPAGNCASA